MATSDTSFGAEPNPPKHSTRSGCSSAEYEGAGGRALAKFSVARGRGRDIECCFLSPHPSPRPMRKMFHFFCRRPPPPSSSASESETRNLSRRLRPLLLQPEQCPRMNVSIVRRPYFLFISLPSGSRRPALVVALLLLLLLGRNRPFSAPT